MNTRESKKEPGAQNGIKKKLHLNLKNKKVTIFAIIIMFVYIVCVRRICI